MVSAPRRPPPQGAARPLASPEPDGGRRRGDGLRRRDVRDAALDARVAPGYAGATTTSGTGSPTSSRTARRAPRSARAQLAAIPGVASVRTRVVMDVTLDVPGLAEPGTGRLVSIPEQPRPVLNDLYLRRGRWIEPGHPDEVLVSEAFGRANGLAPGDSIPAVINGRWQRLRIVGIALSPEYVYEIRGRATSSPTTAASACSGWANAPSARRSRWRGRSTTSSIALAPGASEADVIDAADRLLAPLRRDRRLRPGRPACPTCSSPARSTRRRSPASSSPRSSSASRPSCSTWCWRGWSPRSASRSPC